MKKILSLSIIITLFSACSDFLTEEPRTFLSPTIAYNTDEGLQAGATGLYDRVSVAYYGNSNFGSIIGLWQCATDLHHTGQEGGYGVKDSDELVLSSESGQLKTTWDYYYQIITNAQNIISYSQKHVWVNEEMKKQVEGEAHFFRAFGHFYLTQFWGDVPVVNQIQKEVKLDWERTPKQRVMEFVISDLEKAVEYLEYLPYKNQQGRITKGTALHLLAYAYLCNGDWAKAEKYARGVIESGKYKLMTSRFGSAKTNPLGNPFWDLFQKDNQNPDADNTEGLFVIQNEPVEMFPEVSGGDIKDYYALQVRFFYPGYYGGSRVEENDANMLKYGGRGKGYLVTSRFWVDSLFVDKTDLRGQYPCVQKTFEKTNGTQVYNWDAPGANKNNLLFRPYPRKWDWDGSSRNGSFGTDATTRDIYLYRLADTYLILAEALYNQGINSEADGAAYYINQVRVRAGATPITAADVTVDYILDERGRELFGEIPRRIDLTRTGKYVERVNKSNPKINGKAEQKHVLLPIPQQIIDLNINKVMSQNEPAW